ncbi:hypothetical protein AQUCO_01400685v1 [Aquilegia coerulea]|uniref:Carboxypeptidase n=1 Tax=Aquilegia coerulea TaxID=218851 RepID=A0A2G5DXQ9_AQUCA|nr:hypothetical protein AQUCO_01400685v1 [Aquilegia coerulea]
MFKNVICFYYFIYIIFYGQPIVNGTKDEDRIDVLPGQLHPVNFTQYGGYISVDNDVGRAFYYYFVEAEDSKESKPLLLWLNRGPGCSSLGTGAFGEVGPFRVQSDGKTLYHHPYAWNKVANVLFLESPTRVGFSYSNKTSDYQLNGDKRTSENNYVFLVKWLQRFPEYKSRTFYLSGESYAGHYVPQLAHNILQHNKMENKSSFINLKGIIIGNAAINNETDQIGVYDYLWTHGIISDETIDNIHKYCNFSEVVSTSDECLNWTRTAGENIRPYEYNIHAPFCFNKNLTDTPKTPSVIADPCQKSYTKAYLNTAKVQKAIHANVTKLNYPWYSCSDAVHDTWVDTASTTLPLLHELMASGLRVWVYSGDMDSVLPITSTKYSLNKLKLPTKTSYHISLLDFAGYTLVYEGDLTFATIRGAGHMVPSDQPTRALALITHFLNGELLPNFDQAF